MLPKTRWVGIDEAGYGPNLGPQVMTAVVAESTEARPPDLWADLAPNVQRANGDASALWIDDSKAIHKAGKGRDRLEAACLALLECLHNPSPITPADFFEAIGAGSLAEIELEPWLRPDDSPDTTESWTRGLRESARPTLALQCPRWRIVGVKTVVVGPSSFNAGLDSPGANKATVHFAAFRILLQMAWEMASDGVVTRIQGDKHGGRHFYYDQLLDSLPDAWIDRGVETPGLSQYTARAAGSRLEVAFKPKADADDGLVALASIVSKTARELWMDAFNRFWARELPGIKPTAGYPVDAARFRAEIQERAGELGLAPSRWWRAR